MTVDEATQKLLERLKDSGMLLSVNTPADVSDDYIYSDGVRKADVLAAIQAAGLAEQYGFAERLRVYYNVMVCVRCAGPDPVAVLHMIPGQKSWGSVCESCAQIIGLRTAQRWAHSLK
jgi:hypothetical protein